MNRIALVTILMASATTAFAQSRPFTPNLTCNQARQIVFSSGAAVLSTGQYTYDRYVRDRSFCENNEVLDPAWVQTRDTPQCPIGYRCRSGPYDFW
ncbi:hypothetical protein AB4Y85_06275 [Microvirga sp. 2YAF29]|uniref:hypothetical protein n=1 Tax=Microvirga sp. 2YAF29 TaxID=3233031 RepID=UPI003F999720